MYKNQINKFTMAKNAAAFLSENQEIISSIPELQSHLSMLKAKCDEIESKDTVRATIRQGMRASKLYSKKYVIARALGVSGAVYAYAVKNKNAELAGKSEFHKSELEFLRDAELSAILRFIGEIAQGNIQSLAPFGITEEKLIEYNEAVLNFEKTVSDSGSSFAVRKGNLKSIKELFIELDYILTATDKLVYSFIIENPGFVTNFKTIRRIKKFGLRHKYQPDAQNPETEVLPVINSSS